MARLVASPMGRKHARSTSKTSPPRVLPGEVLASAGGGARVSSPAVKAGKAPGGRAAVVASLALLALIGLHLGWRVVPALRYQQSAPPFFLETAFLARFSGMPGGLLRCLAAALAQFNVANWLGALAFTVVLAGILVCARRLCARVSEGEAIGAAWALVVLVAALPGRYEGEAEGTALGVLTALLAGNAWMAFADRSGRWRLVWCWMLAAGVFYGAGTLPTALFVVVAVVDEAVVRRQPKVSLSCALALLVVPFWAWCRPGFDPSAAIRQWGGGLTLWLHATVFLLVPVWILLRAAWPRGKRGTTKARSLWFGWGLGLAACLVLVSVSVDSARQSLARVEYFAGRREWDQALAAARDVRTWTASARLQLTRVLFHTGQLPEKLFTFPQVRGTELFPDFKAGLEMSRAQAEVLFELGQVNLAEHMAHEALELEGATPDNLRLIAHINILKGRPEAARVFLNRLRLAPFHAAAAERDLRDLATDPGGANNAELSLIRARMPRTDEPDSHLPTEALLHQLLVTNPTNQMASAYLQAYYLLNSQVAELVTELGRLERLGVTVLPRPVEEALAVHRRRAPGDAGALAGVQISPNVAGRYRRFTERCQRQNPQAASVRAALAPEFGDTFWFYDLFGESAPQVATGSSPR